MLFAVLSVSNEVFKLNSREDILGRVRAGLDRNATNAAAAREEVLAALADRAVRPESIDRSALPAVTAAASHADPLVRVAALAALAMIGDASSVPLLASRAAASEGEEREGEEGGFGGHIREDDDVWAQQRCRFGWRWRKEKSEKGNVKVES